jgi:hypothetical protein
MSGRQGEGARAPAAGRDDLKRVLGDIDDSKAIEILALRPTVADLEEAILWAAGDGDVLAKSGRPLTATTAAIVDILSAGETEEPD